MATPLSHSIARSLFRARFPIYGRSPISSQPVHAITGPIYLCRIRQYANLAVPPSPQVGPQFQNDNGDDAPEKEAPETVRDRSSSSRKIIDWRSILAKMLESSLTTLASVAVLALAGYGYHRYYKDLVFRKVELAFKPGDPALDLAVLDAAAAQERPDSIVLDQKDEDGERWLPRVEQARIDAIVDGTTTGRYHLLLGEKGTGKSSMLLDAMSRCDGEGVSVVESHADLEIFRIRLGKALNYEFHEDYIGSLFSIRGPRDTTALLDIERAFNKLEKVALNHRRKVGRPLVLIINSTHLLRDDDDGKDLLELIQQRAEQWAAGNLLTVIMNSDDYWVYERLKIQGTRLEVIQVGDLTKDRAMAALRLYRLNHYGEELDPSLLEQIYNRVGGRPAFLNRVARSTDMLRTCDEICEKEKTWFLNKCWILGEAMDDDVMDQQKFASAAMVLAKALVDKAKDMKETYNPDTGYILPQLPLHEARQIMTRADFIQGYDQINVFTIDPRAMVRADSVPMQRAFEEICSQEGFDAHLQGTLDRISAIESLGRTRELTLKDLWEKGQYEIQTRNSKGQMQASIVFQAVPKEDDAA